MSKIKQILIGIGTFIGGLILTVLGLQRRKIRKQAEEIKEKDTQIKRAVEQQEEVIHVQEELKKTEEDVEQPEVVPPPDPGDSSARISRLNQL